VQPFLAHPINIIMTIGFDAKRAAQNRTGLGNYSRYVIRILQKYAPEQSLHLYIPNPKKEAALRDIDLSENVVRHYPKGVCAHLPRAIWRSWGVSRDLRKDGIDLFHGLSNELPLNIRKSGCKSIVTIHDLIFKSHPQYYKAIDRKIYDFKFRRACEDADRVIAVSEFTKQKIIESYGITAEKITVVYQGCDPAFAADIDDEALERVRAKYSLPPRYVLYVGSIEERKNLMLVAQAMRKVAPSGLKVVAVGKVTPYLFKVKEFLHKEGLEDSFLFLHNVPFADLPALYRRAAVFVYPSRIEGFGIPLLEAVSGGVPAIGCTGSCLEEAGGPGGIYVDPDDAEAMAESIMRVCDDPDLAQRMRNAGFDYALRFGDEAIAAQLMEVYDSVLAS